MKWLKSVFRVGVVILLIGGFALAKHEDEDDKSINSLSSPSSNSDISPVVQQDQPKDLISPPLSQPAPAKPPTAINPSASTLLSLLLLNALLSGGKGGVKKHEVQKPIEGGDLKDDDTSQESTSKLQEDSDSDFVIPSIKNQKSFLAPETIDGNTIPSSPSNNEIEIEKNDVESNSITSPHGEHDMAPLAPRPSPLKRFFLIFMKKNNNLGNKKSTASHPPTGPLRIPMLPEKEEQEGPMNFPFNEMHQEHKEEDMDHFHHQQRYPDPPRMQFGDEFDDELNPNSPNENEHTDNNNLEDADTDPDDIDDELFMGRNERSGNFEPSNKPMNPRLHSFPMMMPEESDPLPLSHMLAQHQKGSLPFNPLFPLMGDDNDPFTGSRSPMFPYAQQSLNIPQLRMPLMMHHMMPMPFRGLGGFGQHSQPQRHHPLLFMSINLRRIGAGPGGLGGAGPMEFNQKKTSKLMDLDLGDDDREGGPGTSLTNIIHDAESEANIDRTWA